MKKTIVVACWIALSLGVPFSALAEGPRELPPQLLGVGIVQKLNGQVPLDLPFVDEEGRTVKLGDYFGKKPVVRKSVV